MADQGLRLITVIFALGVLVQSALFKTTGVSWAGPAATNINAPPAGISGEGLAKTMPKISCESAQERTENDQ